MIGPVGVIASQQSGAAAASPPSTPTILNMADNTNGQSADLRFSWSNNNGASLSSIDVRWSLAAGMTSPNGPYNKTSAMFTYPGLATTALASASPGTYLFATGSVTTPAGMPADGVNAYYQVRLNNSAGSSAWSAAYGPVATSTAGG